MSFSFGTATSAPANTSLTSGFNFGANKPATTGFGLTATSQPSTGLFGNTSTTPAFGATSGFGLGSTPAFGATATPAFGATAATPAFGSTATPAFGNTSATPAFGSTATPAFGASSATPAFGATGTSAFGTASAAPAFGAASATPAFGAASATPAFGTVSATPAFGTASAAPAFGTASATPAFGTAGATPAFGATSTAPAFGATTTPAFGASTSAPAFGSTATPAFGTATTSAFGATTTPAFGTGSLSFGTGTTTAASTGLSFGTPATTKAGLGGLGGFGFGTSTAAQSSFGLLNTSTATTTSSAFGLGLGTTNVSGTQPSTSVAPSLGLGGVAPSGTATSSTTGDGKSEPPKQTKVPNEISTLVDTFKEFVKKQKSLSSEVMRLSIKPLHKVGREAESTLRAALALRGETNKARAQSRRLRTAAADALAAAESAARDPPGSELEGSAPPRYIKELIAELEQQIITFRRQMDVADKQMQASPKLLTEQELTLGIRRMHESLVALAGRLQAVHAQVEAQKEQYLNLRKYILKDPTNVFDTQPQTASLHQILHDAEGARKKIKPSTIPDISLSVGSAVLSDPRAALGNLQQLAGPPPFTYLGRTLSPFPTVDGSGTNWQPQPQTNFNTSSLNLSGFGATSQTDNSGFQLQKPPGKRGKQ
ncbi:nuclear pore complex protein Nup58-like [Battus philenor]|uniref:nuclear pore complex protein Nup58-like n=1 Tax=Battus philenor TaxID=42288 RepID=UPI0035CFC5AB